MSERITGTLIKSHGVHGELVMAVSTDEPEKRFIVGNSVTIREKSGAIKSLTISRIRPHGDRLLISFAEVSSKNCADQLRGSQLLILDKELGTPEDPDEYYDYQLENLAVYDLQHNKLGIISEVLHLPAGDTLVITLAEDQKVIVTEQKQLLIPFTQQFVPSVDLHNKCMSIDPPEGLWESQGQE